MQLKLLQPTLQTSTRNREKAAPRGKLHAVEEVPSSSSSSSACSLNTFNLTMQGQSLAVSFGMASDLATNPAADWTAGANCTPVSNDCDALLVGFFHLPSLRELLDV